MAYSDHLQKKYGNKFTSIESVLTDLRNEVLDSVRKHNKKAKADIVKQLVEEKRSELNLICNSQASVAKVVGKRNVQKQVKRRNSDDKSQKPNKKRQKYSSESNSIIDQRDIEMYNQWKEDNIESRIPTISVQKLLLMIEEIQNDDRMSKEQQQLNKCVSFQNNSFDTFWDAIQPILKGLRHSLLTRNWNNMTCLLLMLISKHRAPLYMPIIKALCDVMLEHNPLIKELGLAEQFRETLSATSDIYKSLR